MKIRLTTGYVADEGRVVHEAGDVVDLPADEAKRLLETDQAEPVAEKRSDQRETR